MDAATMSICLLYTQTHKRFMDAATMSIYLLTHTNSNLDFRKGDLEIHGCCYYGVATISRLLQIIGLFGKRALYKRLYSAKETYDLKEPTNRGHPILHSELLNQQLSGANTLLYFASNNNRVVQVNCLSYSFFIGSFIDSGLTVDGRFDVNFQKRPVHMKRDPQTRPTQESYTKTHHFNHPVNRRLDVNFQKRPIRMKRDPRMRASKEY